MRHVLLGLMMILLGSGCAFPRWVGPPGMSEQQVRYEIWDCENRADTAHGMRNAGWDSAFARRDCLIAKGFRLER